MAVEARRMNLLLPNSDHHFINMISNNRDDFMKQNQGIIPNTQMIPTTEPAGLWPYTAAKPSLPPETMMYDLGKAESGLTSNNAPTTRKRTRRSVYDEATDQEGSLFCRRLLTLDEEIINSHIHQQQSEIDRFIAIHREKVRMEMEVRKKRESGMLVRAIEERVVKKLKEKEEEIERMGKLNWVLQERVKRLCIENQVWRDLAESNEATVNSLRNNLEQVIMAAAANNVGGATAEEEEAESSCGSSRSEAEEVSGGGGGGGGGRCRKCGAGETRVLVLPCRHLCLCTMCGSTLIQSCPVCNSAINASVHVNFS